MKRAKFTKWWAQASSLEKRRVARAAGTTYNYLAQVVCGAREISAELAGRLEVALDGGIKRGDLCETCRRCNYYKGER